MPLLHPSRRLPRAGFPLVLVAIGACSELPVVPEPRHSLPPVDGLSMNASTGMPDLVPNRIKYSDRSLRNATGRAGSASVTARALLGRDGMVDLEVTTGALDSQDTPPGNLDKVQVKGLGTDGEALWTLNHNRLRAGGYWSARYAGLPAGSAIQVQSNVSGVDPNRVGVVTLVETAKRRPDVTVTEVAAPTSASPNSPVEIAATIRELNGDIGARATCRLSVDGSEVDRAEGIWVDASGIVTCAFTHSFSGSGTRQLTVDVVGVRPGDWDEANNTMSRTIAIRRSQDFNYIGFVQDMTYDIRWADTADYTWTDPAGRMTGSYWAHSGHEYGRSQVAIHSGDMPTDVAFPISRVEFTHASNGQAIAAVVRHAMGTEWVSEISDAGGTRRWTCGDLSVTTASAGRLYASICAIHYTNPSGIIEQRSSTFSHWRWAGDVTYRSRNHYRYRYQNSSTDPVTEDFYDQNHEAITAYGLPLPALGSSYEMSYNVTGADGRVYSSTAVVPLAPFTSTGGWPYMCWDVAGTWADLVQTGTACSAHSFIRTGFSGVTAGRL